MILKKGRHLQSLTPHYKPDQGDISPEEPAKGTATRIVADDSDPTSSSRLIQGYLDHTGIEACVLIIRWTMEFVTQIVTIAREP